MSFGVPAVFAGESVRAVPPLLVRVKTGLAPEAKVTRFGSVAVTVTTVPSVCLVILDGWGLAPEGPGNAVALADTPIFDGLWERHEVEIPPREYPVRVRHPAHGIIRADVALMPVYPRLWLYVMVLPEGIEPRLQLQWERHP